METPTSTSKVKVEYSDPFRVYQLIASDLQARLPLNNLNWTSASRPTRSIDSLYVDVVPDENTFPLAKLKRSPSDSSTPDSPASPSGSTESKRQDTQPIKRERRHQIPGLRRTPYLKIYLLRCDDSDTYKATARRAIREWIKANSAASQNGSTSSQENHDAFEYMIVHVVLPDVHNGAAWPTKASTSVLDKLKSDFNSSSKGIPDRVVQIPSTKNLQVQGVTVSPVPAGPAKDVFHQDSAKAWDNLIARMKFLILNSFDSRVKQYEEDIKEKGNQRSLPGWNFCTFFVLKEGLARGFESVGLVDDALMGYDELAVELSSAIREDHTKESRLFREHTQELLIQAEAALRGLDPPTGRSNYKRLSDSVLDTDSKPYRELILANNISIFDFRNYVFARQTQLMLRLASLSGRALQADSSTAHLTTPRDPVILADICWRAKEYFADVARIIRQDLKVSFKPQINASERELRARYVVTENLIVSWIYKGAVAILNKTRDFDLPDVAAPEIEDEILSSGASQRSSSPKSDTEALSPDVSISSNASRPIFTTSIELKKRLSLNSIKSHSAENAFFPPGVSSLAVERAELYLIARRALSSVGDQQGWKTVWPTTDDEVQDAELDDISLEDPSAREEQDSGVKGAKISDSSMIGILDPSMQAIVADKTNFYRHWEELSLLAFLLFEVAKVRKSVYLVITDIAAVRVRLRDYAYAAPHLRNLALQYATDRWQNLEVAVLDMYVFCLNKLGKIEEYVPAALKMLAKLANINHATSGVATMTHSSSSTPFSNINLRSIIDMSAILSKPVEVSIDAYFNKINLDTFIQHSSKSDDYSVSLSFDSQVFGNFHVDQINVRLTSVMEGISRSIVLSSAEPLTCRQGSNTVYVSSKTMFPGWFVVQSITFTCGKIVFFFSSKGTSVTHRNIQTATISSKILLWPLAEACKVEATVYKSIQLENPRAIVFEISSYRNNISHASLLIKSGSAGLRLHTSDAQIVGGDCEILDDKQPSIVHLGAISPNSKVEIKVPYRVEGDMKEVIVRSELSYNVHGCTFVHGSNHRLAIQLPLGVNVQDIFKKNVLFSKFSISTSSEVPIRIAKCSLNGNDMYEVSTPYIDGSDFVVFPKQPLSLVYRIDKMHKTVARKGSKKLSLQIDYQCLDEQVVDTVCNHFTLALKESGFGTYDTLLQSRFKEFLKENQKQDLERVGLLDEIKVPSYVELEWDGILTILPLDIRTRLTSWLREWHKKNIALTVQQEGQRKIRHIEIPMEIPSVPVLHTVSLVVESRSPSRPYTVGEVITGELHITLTRCWSTDENKPSDSSPFIYEIEASPEIWLVAGQRRAYFTACEGEMKKFPIMLLPLRAGKLMLPGIEVRPAIDDEIDGRNKCETDYQSLGTAIEVVPGITGVSLDIATSSSGGLDGEVKVLEVERGGRAVA